MKVYYKPVKMYITSIFHWMVRIFVDYDLILLAGLCVHMRLCQCFVIILDQFIRCEICC